MKVYEGSFHQIPCSSVGTAMDYKSQGCGFESHNGQDFFSVCILLLLTCSWRVDWSDTNEIKHDIRQRYIVA